MANVGRYTITLAIEDHYSKPLLEASKQSERFSEMVTASSIATRINAASTTQASLATGVYANSAAVAAATNTTFAAASLSAYHPINRLAGAIGEAKHALDASHRPLTSTFLGMNRLQLATGEAKKSQQAWNRIAAVTTGQVGILGAMFARMTPKLSEFDTILIQGNAAKGYKFLTLMTRAVIGLNMGFGGLTRGTAAVFGGIYMAADAVRKAIGGFRTIATEAGNVTGRFSALGRYLQGAFGPALRDIAVSSSFAWKWMLKFPSKTIWAGLQLVTMKGIIPLTFAMGRSLAAGFNWLKGMVNIKEGVSKVSISVSNFGLVFAKISEWMYDLAARFPLDEDDFNRLGRGFEAAGKWIAKTGANLYNYWGKGLFNVLGFTKNMAIVFSKVMAGVAVELAKRVASGAKILWGDLKLLAQGFQFVAATVAKAWPYVLSFGKGLAYVTGEITKGVMTSLKLVSGIGFLGSKLLEYTGAVIGAAGKTGLLLGHFLRSNGLASRFVKGLVLSTLAASGLGGAMGAVAFKTLALMQSIPGLNRVFALAGKAATFLAGKLALVTTAGLGLGAIAGGGLALLVKSQFEAAAAATKTADKIGIQTESLLGLQHAARMKGIEDFDSQLSGLNKTLREADPQSPLAKSLLGAGLSLEKLRSQAPDQAMAQIADAMQGLTSNVERTKLAVHLFGEEGQSMARLLADGSEGLKAAAKDADLLGLSFNRVDAAMIDQANAAVGRLKSMFAGIGRQIAIQVAPFIEALAVKLVAVGTSGGTVGDLVASGLKMAGNAAVWLLDAFGWVNDAIGRAQSYALLFTASVTNGMASILESSSWIAKGIDLVIVGFSNLRIMAIESLANVVDTVTRLASKMYELATPYIGVAVDAFGYVKDAAIEFGKGVVQVFETVWSWLPSLPDWLGGGAKTKPEESFTRIGKGLRDTAEEMRKQLGDRKAFSFDHAISGLHSFEEKQRELSRKIEKEGTLTPFGHFDAGELGQKTKNMFGEIAANARNRAEETAKQVAEGSKGIIDAAAENATAKTEKLKEAMTPPDENAALLRGTAAAFAAEQVKPGSTAQGKMRGTSIAQTRATTAATPVKSNSRTDTETIEQTKLLRQILDTLKAQGLAGNSFSLEPGTI